MFLRRLTTLLTAAAAVVIFTKCYSLPASTEGLICVDDENCDIGQICEPANGDDSKMACVLGERDIPTFMGTSTSDKQKNKFNKSEDKETQEEEPDEDTSSAVTAGTDEG